MWCQNVGFSKLGVPQKIPKTLRFPILGSPNRIFFGWFGVPPFQETSNGACYKKNAVVLWWFDLILHKSWWVHIPDQNKWHVWQMCFLTIYQCGSEVQQRQLWTDLLKLLTWSFDIENWWWIHINSIEISRKTVQFKPWFCFTMLRLCRVFIAPDAGR